MASLLVITVLLPLVGSLVLFAAPGLGTKQARTFAIGTVLATLGLSLILVLKFKTGVTTPQFAFGPEGGPYGVSWIDRLGVRFALGLDGISLWLFALTSLLMITAVFASWESVKERAATHYGLLLALQTGLLGLFGSLDVVMFYIFFEFTLIPLFFLIGFYGGPDRRRASVTFFLYTLAGSVLTLLGVIGLVAYNYLHTQTMTFSLPGLTASLANLQPSTGWFSANSWSSPQVLLFLLLFAGFAVKVPMFPFHTWLPLAHVEAPTAGSILLAGVMLKVGGYGLLRFNLWMTPLGAEFLFPWLASLSVIGILYGALAALAQTDVKRLVAYSSVSHMGFIVLGLFCLNGTGMDGAVIQMINHGLTTGALFACVGVIYERYHTREMSELGGLWNRLPLWAFFFILACLGSAALPGLNGFVGEFPILLGMYQKSPEAATWASLGMILGAFYLLWMLQRVVFGPLKEPSLVHSHGHGEAAVPKPDSSHDQLAEASAHHGHDHGHAQEQSDVRPIGWHEIAGLTPLMVLIVLIGISPGFLFSAIRPSVAQLTTLIAKERSLAVAPPPPAASTVGTGRGAAAQPATKKAAGPAAKKDAAAATKGSPAAKATDAPAAKSKSEGSNR